MPARFDFSPATQSRKDYNSTLSNWRSLLTMDSSTPASNWPAATATSIANQSLSEVVYNDNTRTLSIDFDINTMWVPNSHGIIFSLDDHETILHHFDTIEKVIITLDFSLANSPLTLQDIVVLKERIGKLVAAINKIQIHSASTVTAEITFHLHQFDLAQLGCAVPVEDLAVDFAQVVRKSDLTKRILIRGWESN